MSQATLQSRGPPGPLGANPPSLPMGRRVQLPASQDPAQPAGSPPAVSFTCPLGNTRGGGLGSGC